MNPDSVTPELVRKQYIMWTGLGYPPVSEIRAVRNCPDGIDVGLRGSGENGHSPLADEAKCKRDDVFDLTVVKGKPYIEISKLHNAEGTGYIQQVRETNHQTYVRESAARDAEQ